MADRSDGYIKVKINEGEYAGETYTISVAELGYTPAIHIVGKPWKVEKQQAERLGNVLAMATILALAAMLYLALGVFAGWMIWG